jgi:hypothetical protein
MWGGGPRATTAGQSSHQTSVQKGGNNVSLHDFTNIRDDYFLVDRIKNTAQLF